jgi:hypothetical protein
MNRRSLFSGLTAAVASLAWWRPKADGAIYHVADTSSPVMSGSRPFVSQLSYPTRKSVTADELNEIIGNLQESLLENIKQGNPVYWTMKHLTKPAPTFYYGQPVVDLIYLGSIATFSTGEQEDS